MPSMLLQLFAFANADYLRGTPTTTSLSSSNTTGVIVGTPTHIHCPNGHNFTCYRGTYGCTDNSTQLCSSNNATATATATVGAIWKERGGEWGDHITIRCGNKTAWCQAGTEDCYDNSAKYCPDVTSPP